MGDLAREIAASGQIRLRFDKVVRRVAQNLCAALESEVPEGATVVVTLTAPIKLPAKTTAVLKETIETVLVQRLHKEDWKGDILGNRVQIRLVPCGRRIRERLVLLVHNDASDAEALLDLLKGLLG